MARVNTYVHVHVPKQPDQQADCPDVDTFVYGPDDEVPEKHAKLIWNLSLIVEQTSEPQR